MYKLPLDRCMNMYEYVYFTVFLVAFKIFTACVFHYLSIICIDIKYIRLSTILLSKISASAIKNSYRLTIIV